MNFKVPFFSLHRVHCTFVLAATGLLASCAIAPVTTVTNTLPAVDIPSSWSSVPLNQQTVLHDAWWHDFNDPVLNQLVSLALSANQDIKIATARLMQARSLANGAKAEWYPQVGVAVSGQRGRESSAEPRIEQGSLGLRAAWEADLFGRGALAESTARSNSASAYDTLQAVRIALAADVSASYFELRTVEQRLALKRDMASLAQQQVTVSMRKFKAGQVTSLDVEQWRAALAQEQAAIIQLEEAQHIRLNQLSVLLGDSHVPELKSQRNVGLPPIPAFLLPAELLERRPDVQLQAHLLDAALARAKIARKEIYPRLQIAWAGTQERLALQGNSATPRLVIGYGLSLTLPIIDGGRIRTNIKIQDARVQEAMAAYEKSILIALVDVENGLIQWSASGKALQEWQQAENAGQLATAKAQKLYNAGTVDLVTVLQARQSQLQASDAVVQALGKRWQAAVDLRRAFAGRI